MQFVILVVTLFNNSAVDYKPASEDLYPSGYVCEQHLQIAEEDLKSSLSNSQQLVCAEVVRPEDYK